jgi:predicted  nucleic acid-binding Zn-ribbon protein
VFDSVINYMDKFGPELLVIQAGFLVILSTLFLWLWFSNRRKYHNLKHAIPATIVKSYLDSIIQNSTALKSSLFRGGGLEVSGVPSVMPLTNLMGGDNLGMSGAPSTALLEDINQKKAMIAALEAQLNAAQGSQRELETNVKTTKGTLSSAESKIKELEALLAQARNGAGGGGSSSGGDDSALRAELESTSKERDEIRDRLKEFEIISDDLANLKRLQQENEQLKRSLAAQAGSAPAAAAPKAAPIDPNNILSQADVSDLLADLGGSSASSSDDTQALEQFLSTPDAAPEADTSEADMLAAMNEASQTESDDNKAKSEKTPEDLLSEFEKMLG